MPMMLPLRPGDAPPAPGTDAPFIQRLAYALLQSPQAQLANSVSGMVNPVGMAVTPLGQVRDLERIYRALEAMGTGPVLRSAVEGVHPERYVVETLMHGTPMRVMAPMGTTNLAMSAAGGAPAYEGPAQIILRFLRAAAAAGRPAP